MSGEETKIGRPATDLDMAKEYLAGVLRRDNSIGLQNLTALSIRQDISRAKRRRDARALEPVYDLLQAQIQVLEAESGLPRGGNTNDPAITDYRALMQEVVVAREEVWKEWHEKGPLEPDR
ncbi:MAG: hypothetical protein AAB440_02205 [Patescibacteria group bacterium]